jgi:hypothetical protein
MPNFKSVLDTATNIIQSLTDNKKKPLHVGEVMSCWTYLAFIGEIIIYEEVGINTTTDTELKELYNEGLKTAEAHKKELSVFMKQEGIPLPSQPEGKPKSDPNAIPLGVKFTDNELANAIAINLVVAADMSAAAASQSLRTDIGLMFLKFQMDKLTIGYKAKALMQKKGWLKIPPFYYPPGLPEH